MNIPNASAHIKIFSTNVQKDHPFCLKVMFSFETVNLWEGWNTKCMPVEHRRVQSKGDVAGTKKPIEKISSFIRKNCEHDTSLRTF